VVSANATGVMQQHSHKSLHAFRQRV